MTISYSIPLLCLLTIVAIFAMGLGLEETRRQSKSLGIVSLIPLLVGVFFGGLVLAFPWLFNSAPPFASSLVHDIFR